jgi:predicted nuclease of predicted toxin-antitoxin system
LERASDSALVERARTDDSVLRTFDLDFGDILALGVLQKPSAIIFRLADGRPASVNSRLASVLPSSCVPSNQGRSFLSRIPVIAFGDFL